MTKNTGILLGVAAVAIVALGAYLATGGAGTNIEEKNRVEAQPVPGTTVVEQPSSEEPKAMADSDGATAASGAEVVTTDGADMVKAPEAPVVMVKGSYEAYAPEKLARAETGDVVLFFHASWCPSCRGLNADIESNVGTIPSGVTILKADYDRETALKQKYGVTTQHTLVQVDKDGNLIKKWSGSSKLSALLAEVQ